MSRDQRSIATGAVECKAQETNDMLSAINGDQSNVISNG